MAETATSQGGSEGLEINVLSVHWLRTPKTVLVKTCQNCFDLCKMKQCAICEAGPEFPLEGDQDTTRPTPRDTTCGFVRRLKQRLIPTGIKRIKQLSSQVVQDLFRVQHRKPFSPHLPHLQPGHQCFQPCMPYKRESRRLTCGALRDRALRWEILCFI